MPKREASVSIESNNDLLKKLLVENKFHADIKFVERPHSDYTLFLIDLSADITLVSQKIITLYSDSCTRESKFVVVLLHGDKVDTEKNYYFQKMLNDLGKDKPLHRLVLTKDLYQKQDTLPVTYFDRQINSSIVSKKINISQKGENLLFPLSLGDFISGLVKTLFLSGTAGKTFWLLGDPLKDLELAYLLKKECEKNSIEELDINANGDNLKDTLQLQTQTNHTRIELGWEAEDTFSDDLSQIVKNYLDKPIPQPANLSIKQKLYLKVIDFFTKIKKPQKSQPRPLIKKIVYRLFLFVIYLNLATIIVTVISTYYSLTQLSNTINQALDGNFQNSDQTLSLIKKTNEIGESGYLFYEPIIEILSPTESEKIRNLYSLNTYSLDSFVNLQQTYNLADTLYQSIGVGEPAVGYRNLGLALHSNLSQIYENINQIKILSSQNKLPWIISGKIKSSKVYTGLETLETQITQFIRLSDIVPQALSATQPQSFVFVSQNSHRTKANGGQISDLLVITLEQGRLVSKNSYSYQDLTVLLAKNTLFSKKSLQNPKDALFSLYTNNPNFPQAAQALSQILEKTLKIKPDYIIAFNDSLYRSLISNGVPIDIDGQKINTTDFDAAMKLSSANRTLRELLENYSNKLLNHEISLRLLGKVISQEIDHNQVFIWAADAILESQILPQNYSGAITSHYCHGGLKTSLPCLAETVYLNESLTSTDSSRVWDGRKLNHTVRLSLEKIEHEFQLNYTSQKETLVDQNIEVEYQIYLPVGYALDKLFLDRLPSSTKNVEKQTENSFDIYKIHLTLPSKNNPVVNLLFSKNLPQTFSASSSYSLTEFQQPGVSVEGTSLKIVYPQSLHPGVVSSPVNTSPNSVDLILPAKTSTFGLTFSPNEN